jgi:AcrR family transcriptional regulator
MPQAPVNPNSADQNAAPSGVRERNVEMRRQQILQAARVLLSRGGLGALSMRKLAEEASLSVNTLYNLWGTREEILRALTLDARERMEASLPIEASPADPIAYCRLLVGATIQELCRQHELFRPMILAWLEGEIAGQPSPIEPMEHSIHMLSQIIQMARKSGLIECPMKPEQVAWQIQHGAQFASIQWALGRIDDTHFEARALYSVNIAFLGIVHEERRPEIRQKLKGLERKLRMYPANMETAPDPGAIMDRRERS